MTLMRFPSCLRSAGLLAAVCTAVLAGCAAPAADLDLTDDGEDGAALTAPPANVDSTHVYLGVPNHLFLGDDAPLVYGAFDLNPRPPVSIALSSEPGTTARPALKIYRVKRDGSLALLGQ